MNHLTTINILMGILVPSIVIVNSVDFKMSTQEDAESEKSLTNKTIAITCHSNVKLQTMKTNLHSDYGNIVILLVLYMMQGIPFGIMHSLPMILQKRGVSYKDQAGLSFSHWPFAIKLLWAPIVDLLYIRRFGRRKCWLVPVTLLIGLSMLALSPFIDDLIGDEEHVKEPQIITITLVFFTICFLVTIQDVARDGWALTMLKKCNIGHVATCNSVGILVGYFIGFPLFTALEAKKIVSFSQFLFFWGIAFIVAIIVIALLKKESSSEEDSDVIQQYGLLESYTKLILIVKKKPVLMLAALLLTVNLMFAASNAITTLKLVDYGIPREKLALVYVFIFPIEIVISFLMTKYTTGPQPLNIFIKFVPLSLLLTITMLTFVWITPYMLKDNLNNIPVHYYVVYILIQGSYQVLQQARSVSQMAFFARISDRKFGGIYLTLLNTISNLGFKWSATFMLWLVDYLTWKSCSFVDIVTPEITLMLSNNTCINKMENENCISNGGVCHITTDGYYIECILCFLFGILWFFWATKKIKFLHNVPLETWWLDG